MDKCPSEIVANNGGSFLLAGFAAEQLWGLPQSKRIKILMSLKAAFRLKLGADFVPIFPGVILSERSVDIYTNCIFPESAKKRKYFVQLSIILKHEPCVDVFAPLRQDNSKEICKECTSKLIRKRCSELVFNFDAFALWGFALKK